jgi:hypothetical protein
MKRAVLTLLFAGCYAHGPVGPYVRSIARTEHALVIERCTIVVEDGDVLRFDTCTTEHVPLPEAR